MFATTGYQNTWNGEAGGKLLTTDTYYYIIVLGPGAQPKVGHVTIIRD